MRTNIIAAVKTILEDMHLFKQVYETPTDIQKERSFPVAWINLGDETFDLNAVNTTSHFRNLELEITIGVKQDMGKDNINAAIDSIYSTLESNYTLNGTVINSTPIGIITDQGYFYPHALASITFNLLVR